MKLSELIRRISLSAALSFWRNGLLSTATVLVMVLALFVIGGLLLSSVLMNSVLDSLQNKIDVSVYFLPNTPEDLILGLKSEFLKIPNVKNILYVSQAEALENFKTKNQANPTIAESLKELDTNPLEGSLNITALDPTKFSDISSIIEARKEQSIDKINFHENQSAIARLTEIMNGSRSAGAVLAVVLIIVAVTVTYNTVRLAIFTAKDEISIMRLVGATAWYVRLPFLLEGVIDGVISAIITTFVFLPIVSILSPKISSFTGGIDLWAYFGSHFFEFFFILLFIGVGLGIISAFLATRKYLKV
ncbi:MAG: ABC transporter permease [Candidatus Sungbacteria bacterium]|uniref:Cell division protein FtsX n=1 Tax=Candidatus Sungiibacteriota bacterium TaxID=2750080 RepID=A0A9D6LMD9_9BACT|nr:ABC transporter permease [Candidatus Sungbacteria bacterium]